MNRLLSEDELLMYEADGSLEGVADIEPGDPQETLRANIQDLRAEQRGHFPFGARNLDPEKPRQGQRARRKYRVACIAALDIHLATGDIGSHHTQQLLDGLVKKPRGKNRGAANKQPENLNERQLKKRKRKYG